MYSLRMSGLRRSTVWDWDAADLRARYPSLIVCNLAGFQPRRSVIATGRPTTASFKAWRASPPATRAFWASRDSCPWYLPIMWSASLPRNAFWPRSITASGPERGRRSRCPCSRTWLLSCSPSISATAPLFRRSAKAATGACSIRWASRSRPRTAGSRVPPIPTRKPSRCSMPSAGRSSRAILGSARSRRAISECAGLFQGTGGGFAPAHHRRMAGDIRPGRYLRQVPSTVSRASRTTRTSKRSAFSTRFQHPVEGDMIDLANPNKFSAGLREDYCGAPLLGGDSLQILSGIGYTERRNRRSRCN